MPATYLEYEIPYNRWTRYLAVALDLEEIDQFHFWVLAQQDPKKFQWSSPDHAGTRPGGAAQSLMEFAGALSGRDPGKLKKRDPWEYGKATGLSVVYKMAELDSDTGKLIRYIYVDENGDRVSTDGYVVLPTKHPEAIEKAESVIGSMAKGS